MHQYSYSLAQEELGIYKPDRFPQGNDDIHKIIVMKLFLKHAQVVGVLMGLEKLDNKTIAMDLCFSPVANHGCVLGAAFEAGLDMKTIVKTGDNQILFPQSPHLKSEQKIGVWLECVYNGEVDSLVNKFDVMMTREPAVPAEGIFLKEKVKEMVEAMRTGVPAISDKIARFWWPNLEERKVLADTYTFHVRFAEGKNISERMIDSQIWRYDGKNV